VTNPPYKLVQKFIEQAIGIIAPQKGKVAMLLRNEYDSAAGRQHLFSGCPRLQFNARAYLTAKMGPW